MKEVRNWHKETLGKKTVEALKRNAFDAVYVSTADEAKKLIASFIPQGGTVGFGGSMTIKDLGIQDMAAQAGAKILDHNDPALSPDERTAVLRSQLVSDLFIASANALTLDGEVVNVDGAGNRVAALTFGPKKSLIVAGTNKIVANMDSALDRLEMVASPMNTKRLNKNTPCVKTGVCVDCDSPERICRVYSFMKRKPTRADITVIIIGEDFGF